MSASADCQLLGRWRIVEAGLWDRDFLDLCGPAYILFETGGHGEFAFGAVQGGMDLQYGKRTVGRLRRNGRDFRFRIGRTGGQWYRRDRTVVPQRRRGRPQSRPQVTSSTAC